MVSMPCSRASARRGKLPNMSCTYVSGAQLAAATEEAKEAHDALARQARVTSKMEDTLQRQQVEVADLEREVKEVHSALSRTE